MFVRLAVEHLRRDACRAVYGRLAYRRERACVMNADLMLGMRRERRLQRSAWDRPHVRVSRLRVDTVPAVVPSDSKGESK